MDEIKFFGQSRVQKELDSYFAEIARGNNINILLSAPSGYGKTTMTRYYLEKNGIRDYNYFLGACDILASNVTIIDEAHMIKVFEPFYPAMDSREYSFIFLTNKLCEIPDAVKTRCYIIVYDDYTDKDIAQIFSTYFPDVSESLLKSLARKALLNPRISHNLASRIKIILGKSEIYTDSDINSSLVMLGIKEYEPLTQKYIDYLKLRGHASLKSICSATGISEDIVINDIEPFLLKHGIIDITSKGRTLQKQFWY